LTKPHKCLMIDGGNQIAGTRAFKL
jgi:hypothetical protein